MKAPVPFALSDVRIVPVAEPTMGPWENILSWHSPGVSTRTSDRKTCLGEPNGVRFLSDEEIPDDEFWLLPRFAGWSVHLLARLMEQRGHQVLEMWENAPDRDRTDIRLRRKRLASHVHTFYR